MENKVYLLIILVIVLPTVYGMDLNGTIPQGWNLVSMPIKLYNETMPAPFESIEGNYSSVFVYDNGEWLSYHADKPAFLNTLKELDVLHGYWIYMIYESFVTINGEPIGTINFTMYEEWNLIGYPYLGSDYVEDVFNDVMNNIISIFKYENDGTSGVWYSYSPDRPSFLNTLDEVSPGFGYWIQVKNNDTWVFDGAFHKEACVPTTEVCDDIDNDCDNEIDEGPLWINKGDPCTEGVGICEASGVYICDSGNPSGPTVCSATPGNPETEVCDGLDNDCDSSTDEDWPELGTICSVGVGQCYAEGNYVCKTDGTGTECDAVPGTPSTEICDGLDNDCDGDVDEGNPGGGGYCNTGLLGVCADGTLTCQGGSLECVQDTPASSEVCDGLDNDCDGNVDEGNPGGGGSCDTGLQGICAEGILMCLSGSLQCIQNNFPETEICDGLDNNCDGDTDADDNDLVLEPCELQLGVCNGSYHEDDQCVSGNWEECDANNYGVWYGIEFCDGYGYDNDCDGEADEEGAMWCIDFYRDQDGDGYAGNDSKCYCDPTGEYNYTSSNDCNDTNPNMYPGNTEVCDSYDNDCDGEIDECGEQDQYEPDNTMETAKFIWETTEITGWITYIQHNLYAPDTEDWEYVSINDSQTETVLPEARLRNIPERTNYDLCIYYDKGKDGTIDYQNCSTNLGNTNEYVSLFGVETGGDDSGYFYAQAKRVSGISCSTYTISIRY